jgi:hypothetical protein
MRGRAAKVRPRADLRARRAGWLARAAADMRDVVKKDWKAWRAHWNEARN